MTRLLATSLFLCSCQIDPNGIAQAEAPVALLAHSRFAVDRSGTRIERWKHVKSTVLDDGTIIDMPATYTLFDTLLGTECTIQRASDGIMRCLPGTVSTSSVVISLSQFSDPACTSAIWYGPFVDTVTKFFADSHNDIYQSGGEIIPTPSYYYEIDAGSCTRKTPTIFPKWPNRAVQINPKMRPTDFIGVASQSTADTKL